MSRWRRFLVAVFILSSSQPGLSQSPPDLKTVLERASQYVAQYESVQLGNLLVREHYLQIATSFSPTRIRTEDRRDIESDFLILQMDGDRRGIRRVDRVDGRVVKSKEASFEKMMDDSPAAVNKRIVDLIEESTRYDIGKVLRQSNVPTFALKVVRKAEKMRFDFKKAGEEKINGIPAWKVAFRELEAPILTRWCGVPSGLCELNGNARAMTTC